MVDGGFYRRRAYARLGDKSPKERADELESYCKRHLNEKIYGIQTSHRLYRIFYYDCLPVSKNIYNPLTKKQVERIIDLALKINDSELIYNVSEILKDRLDKENVSKISKEMSKQENVYYVYEFLCTFKDKLSKEDKNKLVSKIINSKEMKLIVLVAVFIDVKLIEKLFKSKKDLFIFAVGLNVFTIEELKKLKEKLDITEEKPNMKNIPKKYKLKKKDK